MKFVDVHECSMLSWYGYTISFSNLTYPIPVINECDSSPCLNGGQCFTVSTGYRCFCPDGFTGVNCETPGKLFKTKVGHLCCKA